MRLRATTPSVLVALSIAIVLVISFFADVCREPAPNSAGAALAEVDSAVRVPASLPATSSVANRREIPAELSERATATLAPIAEIQVADEAALRLLASTAPLALTDEQWSTFARVTAHYQAVRQAYEASIARVVRSERGLYRIEVPAYPIAGDALRARFAAEVREALGEQVAGDISMALGQALEGTFGGFGVAVQTLDFEAASGGDEAGYQVTRTVQYWNSVEALPRLTTRRETHFPGLEDPDGHRWGPFLSILAAQTSGRAGS